MRHAYDEEVAEHVPDTMPYLSHFVQYKSSMTVKRCL